MSATRRTRRVDRFLQGAPGQEAAVLPKRGEPRAEQPKHVLRAKPLHGLDGHRRDDGVVFPGGPLKHIFGTKEDSAGNAEFPLNRGVFPRNFAVSGMFPRKVEGIRDGSAEAGLIPHGPET